MSAIEAAEGKGTTFYSWLGVSPSASTQEISKAYRKKSLQLQCVLLHSARNMANLLTSQSGQKPWCAGHPRSLCTLGRHHGHSEGFRGSRKVVRLCRSCTVLTNINHRYNFFYKNGVPKWRGTGYYYSRFRPGLFVSCNISFYDTDIDCVYRRSSYSSRCYHRACIILFNA